MSHSSSPSTDVGFDPAALVAACAFPGAGHLMRNERTRGICVMTGVLGLFLGGIFVGGIDVVDRQEDGVWFIGQALVGPLAFSVDYYHQNHLKVLDGRQLRSAYPDEGRDPTTAAPIPGGTPPNRKSVGKANELGTLAGALAGMMNLIAVLDAGFPTRRRRGAGGGGAAAPVPAVPTTPAPAMSAEAKP